MVTILYAHTQRNVQSQPHVMVQELRICDVPRCQEIDVLYAAIQAQKMLQSPYIIFPMILREDNYGYVLSTHNQAAHACMQLALMQR